MNSWNIYPRPQMVRNSFINLNGEWDFTEGDKNFPESYSERITVPYPMESELSGIGRRHRSKKYMWYKREIYITEVKPGYVFLLHCGGVDQRGDVWINGIHQETIDFVRDTIELSGIKEGINEVVVRVYDDIYDLSVPYGKQSRKPAGMWYTPVSGIWQTIWIEQVPEKHIKDIRITPSKYGAEIKVLGATKGKITLDDGSVFELNRGIAFVQPKNIKYWSPGNPYLYHFTINAGEDEVRSYFALRTLALKKKDGVNRIMLNEKPVFFHGLLDQGYWPDGIYTPKSPDMYKEDILNAKKLGFNMLRKHIKVEPEVFYYLCDSLGMMVFQDMVNNSDYSFIRDTAMPTFGFQWMPDYHLHSDMHSRNTFYKHAKHTVKRLFNHPCIVYWTIFNEGWGQFHVNKMFDCFKQWDKTRIIDSASGWFKTNRTDVVSDHVYFHRYYFRDSKKPIILSEFGGYAYKIKEHSHHKRKQFGYAKFSSRDKYNQALMELYMRDVLPYIERGLCGSVYTQVCDVETEENGLYTYDRKHCKVDEEKMQKIAAMIQDRIDKG